MYAEIHQRAHSVCVCVCVYVKGPVLDKSVFAVDIY